MKPTVESEKDIEKKLAGQIDSLGGWSVKLLSIYVKGLPDRLCLFPGGKIAFAEVKTTKKKPTKIQKLIHRKLRALGFTVVVIDSTTGINEFLEKYR